MGDNSSFVVVQAKLRHAQTWLFCETRVDLFREVRHFPPHLAFGEHSMRR